MILCPNCQHKEVSGAVFCSECGAQLLSSTDSLPKKINDSEPGKDYPTSQGTAPLQSTPPASLNTWISLHMVESGQILALADRKEFTLGRVSEGQPIMPDVDLSPYNAYALGVSRLHALLKMINNTTIIMDLGSSNGTFINNNQITPHVEQTLSHGDIVSLGKLRIQVLVNQPNP